MTTILTVINSGSDSEAVKSSSEREAGIPPVESPDKPGQDSSDDNYVKGSKLEESPDNQHSVSPPELGMLKRHKNVLLLTEQ